MKNLIIIITIMLCSILAKAQVQEKNFDDIINLGLPSYLYKPNNPEITDFIKNRPLLYYKLPINHAVFYTYGEILVYLWANKGIVRNNILEENKKFNDYMNEQGTGTTNYSSEIKNINNAAVLIVHEERATNYCSYNIYAINGSSKQARIRIDYKLSDKSEAQKIAESILANLRFEEAPLRPRGPARAN